MRTDHVRAEWERERDTARSLARRIRDAAPGSRDLEVALAIAEGLDVGWQRRVDGYEHPADRAARHEAHKREMQARMRHAIEVAEREGTASPELCAEMRATWGVR